jgi:hypothetical protein
MHRFVNELWRGETVDVTEFYMHKDVTMTRLEPKRSWWMKAEIGQADDLSELQSLSKTSTEASAFLSYLNASGQLPLVALGASPHDESAARAQV